MSTLNGSSRGGDIGGGCHSERPSAAQATILGSAGLAETPQLDFEAWTAFLRTSCGNQPDVIDPRAFTGWVRPMTVCGLDAAELKIECGSPPMDRGPAVKPLLWQGQWARPTSLPAGSFCRSNGHQNRSLKQAPAVHLSSG